jgi:hypothetical protein
LVTATPTSGIPIVAYLAISLGNVRLLSGKFTRFLVNHSFEELMERLERKRPQAAIPVSHDRR